MRRTDRPYPGGARPGTAGGIGGRRLGAPTRTGSLLRNAQPQN